MCQHLEDLHTSVNYYFPNDQNMYRGIRSIIKNRPMGFNITECEKLIDMASDSMLQITFRKLLFIKFGCSTKEKELWLFENAIKIVLSFQTTYLFKAGLSSYTSIQHNKWHAEADETSPVFYCQTLKWLAKCKIMPLLLIYVLENSSFSITVWFTLTYKRVYYCYF